MHIDLRPLSRRCILTAVLVLASGLVSPFLSGAAETESAVKRSGRFLYAATPGIRNYMSYGGIGVLVFDASDGHKMVKRIPTWPEPANGQEACSRARLEGTGGCRAARAALEVFRRATGA